MYALLAGLRGAPSAARSIINNFGWMAGSRVIAAVLSLIYLAIVTRTLGAAGFGRFALINGAAQILSNLLEFQTWQIIVQFGLPSAENRDEARLARLYRFAIVLDVIGAIAGIVASAVILRFFADALGIKDTLANATLVFNTIMLLAARSTPLGILRLRDRFSVAAMADTVTPTLRLVGAIAAARFHPTLQGFLIAWAVAEMLTWVAYWFAVWRIGEMRLLFRRVGSLRAVFAENPGILRYALTTNFSQSLMTSSRQLPVFLAGGLTGVAAAGAFRLAAQLSRSLTLLAQMIARAAFPEIVRAVRTLGIGGIGAMLLRTTRFAAIFAAIVFIIAFAFGTSILTLIGGPEFASGYISLLWLAGAGCIDVIVVVFEPSLAAANRAHLGFIARLLSTVVLIAGALILEPVTGHARGVAAAVFLTALCQALLVAGALLWVIHQGRRAPVAE